MLCCTTSVADLRTSSTADGLLDGDIIAIHAGPLWSRGMAPFRGRQGEIRSESRAVTASGNLRRRIGIRQSAQDKSNGKVLGARFDKCFGGANRAYNSAPFLACPGQEVTMKDQISRRQFTKLAIGAAIVGFNPDARSWVTRASSTARVFDRLPKLDGALLLDEESRRAVATDQGNMFHRVPAAVLRPGSVEDVVAMVRYANQHQLKVAIRGNGHSRYGQTQAEAGLVIDSRSLNAVRVRTLQSADAQLGALWNAVLDAALAKGLTPRVVPGTCLQLLTVGAR